MAATILINTDNFSNIDFSDYIPLKQLTERTNTDTQLFKVLKYHN